METEFQFTAGFQGDVPDTPAIVALLRQAADIIENDPEGIYLDPGLVSVVTPDGEAIGDLRFREIESDWDL